VNEDFMRFRAPQSSIIERRVSVLLDFAGEDLRIWQCAAHFSWFNQTPYHNAKVLEIEIARSNGPKWAEEGSRYLEPVEAVAQNALAGGYNGFRGCKDNISQRVSVGYPVR